MVGIDFDKSKAEHFLDCLANGKPIRPQDGRGWTGHDMLALAGACYFAAMSHGPALYQGIDRSKYPAERREAIDDTFFGDLSFAIEFYGHLTMLVQDNEYAAHGYASHCQDDGDNAPRRMRRTCQSGRRGRGEFVAAGECVAKSVAKPTPGREHAHENAQPGRPGKEGHPRYARTAARRRPAVADAGLCAVKPCKSYTDAGGPSVALAQPLLFFVPVDHAASIASAAQPIPATVGRKCESSRVPAVSRYPLED